MIRRRHKIDDCTQEVETTFRVGGTPRRGASLKENFMRLQLGQPYNIRFSGTPLCARMHYKPEDAETFGPFDYVEVKSDGIVRLRLEGAGDVPGTTLGVTGVFRAGHAFKFQDLMKAGPVIFSFADSKLSVHTPSATIPLEIDQPGFAAGEAEHHGLAHGVGEDESPTP
jgi:hypothetical protein